MNPYLPPSINLYSYWNVLWRNRGLIVTLTKREVLGRYKGSLIGLMWSFLNPIMLLTLYTLIFSGIFNAGKNIMHGERHFDYAFFLFIGLIVHGMLVEVLAQAPTLIIRNANFVTKVPFPIEILPVVQLLVACMHACISIFLLLVMICIFQGGLRLQILLLPALMVPYALFILGAALMLSSLGVYLRDLGHLIGFGLTVVLFASPIFYSLDAVPSNLQNLLYLNPLTFTIEQARDLVFSTSLFNVKGYFAYFIACVLFCWLGYVCFQKSRRGFANVL